MSSIPPRRIALVGVTIALASVATAYASAFAPGGAPSWAAWAMMGGTVLLHAALLVLGAAGRHGLPRSLWWTFGVTALACVAAFGVALVPPSPDEPLLFGLPRRTALLLGGVGVVPLVLLPLAYAATFDSQGLDDATIAAVRAAAAARRPGGSDEDA